MKIIIVGIGKFGFKVASTLALEENAEVTVLDKKDSALERITDYADVMPIKGNGVYVTELEGIDIQNYDLGIACTGSDETNIICCTVLKNLGCKKTIATIRNPEYTEQRAFIKKTMSIDLIINPEFSTAKSIFNYLSKSYSFNVNNFALTRVSMFDFYVKDMPKIVGKKVKDVSGVSEFVITAILRGEDMVVPNGETVILEDDLVYIMGETEKLSKFMRSFKPTHTPDYVKNVVIVGGGKIGYYLAKLLSLKGIHVKLIEKDHAVCEMLAEKLPNDVLVLQGDGSDFTLLQEEDVMDADAFVCVTGYDEENLLLSLAMKKFGVTNCVAKVSRDNYTNIMETLGVDSVFATMDIATGHIIKYYRGGNVKSVSLLLGGKAEVNEIIATEAMPVVGKPLQDVSLPNDVVIGAILTTENEVIIPNGATVIHPGDRFVVFSGIASIQKAKSFFEHKK